MAILSLNRPVSDPISVDELMRKILADTGLTVTAVVSPSDISLSGTISEANRTALQASISNYVYLGPDYGNLVSTSVNTDMSANRVNVLTTERAVYGGDTAVAAIANSKTTNRTYINGVAKNGTAVTGDVVEWIVTLITSGGVVTDYVTTQGATRTSGGTALLSTLFPDSIQTNFIDSSGVYAQGNPTVTSNKTVSIPFTKQGFTGVTLLSTNILGSVAMSAIPDGVTVKVRLVGVAA